MNRNIAGYNGNIAEFEALLSGLSWSTPVEADRDGVGGLTKMRLRAISDANTFDADSAGNDGAIQLQIENLGPFEDVKYGTPANSTSYLVVRRWASKPAKPVRGAAPWMVVTFNRTANPALRVVKSGSGYSVCQFHERADSASVKFDFCHPDGGGHGTGASPGQAAARLTGHDWYSCNEGCCTTTN